MVNLLSGDMRVERLLEDFEWERVGNKSSDPVLSRIAGEVSDEQFQRGGWARQTGKRERERTACDLLKLGQSLNDTDVAEVFSQPKTVATSRRMGLTLGV